MEQEQAAEQCQMIKFTLPFIRTYPIQHMYFDSKAKLLAVARSDSSIEIWSYPSWSLLTRINLNLNLVIRRVALITVEGTLFAVAVTANGYIVVYDTQKGEVKQTLLHGGDLAWDAAFFVYQFLEGDDMEAEDDLSTYALVTLACDDGTQRIFKMNDKGNLIMSANSAGYNSECTSICLSFDGSHCYGGFADCTIRKVSTSNGKTALTINTGQNEKGEKITSLKFVEPYYLAVGYSTGKLRFFETTFGTMLKEFCTHEADILALLVSLDSTKIYATGADSKIVCFNKIVEDLDGFEKIDFEYSSSDRGQSHDINSLVELHDDLIISGGNSTDICLYKVVNGRFQDRRRSTTSEVKLRHITYQMNENQVDISYKSKILVTSCSSKLDIFLADLEEGTLEYLCKIERLQEPIECFALSQKLPIVAYATSEVLEVLWFKIGTGEIRRVNTGLGNLGALALKFVGKYLFIVTTNRTLISFNCAEKTSTKYSLSALKEIGKFDVFDVSVDRGTALMGNILLQKLVLVNLSNGSITDISSLQQSRFMNARFSPRSADAYITYTTNKLIIVGCSGKPKFVSTQKLPHTIHKLHDRFYSVVFPKKSKSGLILASKYSLYKLNPRDDRFASIRSTKERELYDDERPKIPSSLNIYKTELPIARLKEFGPSGIAMIRFSWENAMSEIPDPVISKRYGA